MAHPPPAFPAPVNALPDRPAEVPRDAVAQRIANAGTARLVLVRAPAGFGKTTALQQAQRRLQAAGVATAWLTLDRADNDVPRFLAGLAQAVQALGRARPASGGAVDVMAALAAEGPAFALFLDDVELVQEPAVIDLLRDLIEHLPRRGQVVIGSRSLPGLGLARLRARGLLLDIDADLLRFALPETADFFRRRGLALTPALVQRLHDKTEGWIAALWLVSLALERLGAAGAAAFVERFSGSDRALADYLAEDVLAHLRPELRDFVLRTSVLRQISLPVCQALLPRADCAALLRELEAAHLFLTPLAGADGSWRYHSLFGDFLRTQLAREQPQQLARLHLAAAGWYEAQGRPVPAIDHAIDGGDHPLALQLLLQHADDFLAQGRMRLLHRWLTALPPEVLAPHPRLQVVAVWAQCFTQGPWAAQRQLDASACASSSDAQVQAQVRALQPMLLAMMDRFDEAYAAGQQSLARLPSPSAFADSVLLNAMAHIGSVMGQQVEAHRRLDAARRTHAGSTFVRMYTEAMEGSLDLKEGRLRQATARFRIAVSATPHAPSYTYGNGNAWAGVLYAGALYEANDLAGAEQLLNVYLPLARDVGLPDHMMASHRMRARIAFGRGEVDTALQLLSELEYLGLQRQLPRVVANAKLERARLLLLQGHGAAARAELARAEDPAVWQRVARLHYASQETDDLPIARWRLDLHLAPTAADAAAVCPPLQAALAQAEAQGRLHRALKLRVLLALAWWRAADRPQALATLRPALQHAAHEGFVRLLLDEGPALGPLLLQLRRESVDAARSEDPIVTDHLQRLLDLLGLPGVGDAVPEPPDAPDTADAAAGSGEPLTRKEVAVLHLLAEGLSNSGMAQALFVSDSTVRTHLRNINTKLGAHSRTQALARARRLGLMP